jgi:PAS domain S-box-containing protein
MGVVFLAAGPAIIVLLYLTSLSNYLLFHSLAEFFSILVGVGIFVIAWNALRFLDNNFLLILGIASLFVGILDLAHTLAYKGMGVFADADANLPTQLWIAARYLQSLTLLAAPFFFGRKLNNRLTFTSYAAASILLLWSIFRSGVFPDCFIEGVGLTPFKKGSEFAICLILAVSALLLLRRRNYFDPQVFRLLLGSIILTMVSELAFTFYVSVYGFSNFVGHILKIFSFYLVYKAIIETALVRPYDLIFLGLKQSQSALAEANGQLCESKRYLSGIIQFLPDATLVIDLQGKVVAWNQAMERLSRVKAEEMIGKGDYEYAIPFHGERRPILVDLVTQSDKEAEKNYVKIEWRGSTLFGETAMRNTQGEMVYLHCTAAALHNSRGKIAGAIESVRDVTERKRSEEERERLIDELQKALAKVNTLSGMLPICACCKMIRDDKGYWNQLEAYISNHADILFSHCLCPDCAAKAMKEIESLKTNP